MNANMFNVLKRRSRKNWRLIDAVKWNVYKSVSSVFPNQFHVCYFSNISQRGSTVVGNEYTRPKDTTTLPCHILWHHVAGVKVNQNHHIFLNKCQKHDFHTSLSSFGPNNKKNMNYQQEEKKEANILICMTALIIVALLWANHFVDYGACDRVEKQDS